MCCNLRIHVIVISIIYLEVTIAYLIRTEIGNRNDKGMELLVCIYSLASGIMCLVGAICNKKFLLIPFIIGVCLIILICVIWLIITIYCWVLGNSLEGATANVTALFFLAYCSVFLGPNTYILVIVAKFYKELASVARQGDWVDAPERVVLASYVSPTVTAGSTVYVAPDTHINVSYASQ